MEVAFKEHVSDRTDWRRMLKGEPEAVDLKASRDALFAQCDETLSDLTDEYDQVDLWTRTRGQKARCWASKVST
jgi:hypothetical protein